MDLLKNIPYEKIGEKYYLVNDELKEFKNKIPLEALSLGVFLGEDVKEKFEPSIALLDMIKLEKIKIDDEAEWLFLCGRDITKNHMINHVEDNGKKLFLVENEKEEILGLGKIKDGLLMNLLDRGDFLRREN